MVRPLSAVVELGTGSGSRSVEARGTNQPCGSFSNKDAVALVASQDRHLVDMHWHEEGDSVVIVRNA